MAAVLLMALHGRIAGATRILSGLLWPGGASGRAWRGALAVMVIGYWLVLRRKASVFGGGFALPTRKNIDARLLGGATVIGIGWGIAGLCPGGSLPALGTGRYEVFGFVAAMIAGMLLVRMIERKRQPAAIALRAALP